MFGSIPPSVVCVRKRFPDKDERDLILNLTQKCRDSAKLPDPAVIERFYFRFKNCLRQYCMSLEIIFEKGNW